AGLRRERPRAEEVRRDRPLPTLPRPPEVRVRMPAHLPEGDRMSCLAEERFVELLDQGGLDATKPEEQAHLERCESCRDSWATIAAAGEVLVEARPRSASRESRLIPMIAAAAMLLTIIGVVALKKIPSTTKP